MRKFSTIKRLLTLEEKQERIDFAKEWGELDINEEEFLKSNIYEEHVLMKCSGCDYEEKVEIDIIDELADMYGVDYPELECPNCNKRKARMIPIDIYNEEKKNK